MAAQRVADRLEIDLEAAEALLAASDGDVETAIAVYVGYNDGDAVNALGDLDAVTNHEVEKKVLTNHDAEGARSLAPCSYRVRDMVDRFA